MLATRMRAPVALRSKNPLSNEDIARIAPSIYAAEAHASRSARYTYIATGNILDGLRREGFNVYEVAQSRCRDASRREHTRHMVRLRRDDGAAAVVGREVPEVVLVNSHDGTSSYQMLAGMFRLVCSNGMIVPSGMVNEVRVPHSGDVLGRVIEGAFTVVGEFDKVRENAERMKALTLSDPEMEAFARAAIVAKHGDAETDGAIWDASKYPVRTDQVLAPRRHEDRGNDLWRTFNRVQENMLRGGLRTYSSTGRRLKTREVTGITQNVALNRALWTLADQMATLKAAA